MGTPIWRGTTSLVQQPESAQLTIADRTILVDVYKGPQAACTAGVLRRGTYGTGLRLGWVLTSCKVDNERGGIGKLTLNWEPGGAFAGSAFLPLSEFDSQVVELYPKIERAAFFSGIAPTTVALCATAAYGSTAAQRSQAITQINALSDPQLTLGKKLLAKYQQGEESWYVAGMRYMLISYSFTFPTLSLGGFIDTPSFAVSAGLSSYSWLQLADFLQPAGVNGSVFKITSTWLGGPVGYWDSDIYS